QPATPDAPSSTTAEPTPTATAEPAAAEETKLEDKKGQKLTQTVEFRDVGPCKKHINVTISRDNIDAKMKEQFTKLTKKDSAVPVAGFRPGKAPRQLIERRFRKDVTDQVRGEILMQSLEQLVEDHQIAPLSSPDIDPAKIEIPKEGPLVYE